MTNFDENDASKGKFMGMVYNKCASIICDEFSIDRNLVQSTPPRARFLSALNAIRSIQSDLVEDRAEEVDDRSDYDIGDIPPNLIRYFFSELCKELRKEIRSQGDGYRVHEYRWLARRVLDRVEMELELTKGINVIEGNFSEISSYMDDVIISYDWLSWYGNGKNIDTMKLRITC